MKTNYCGDTNIGNVRPKNEDNFVTEERPNNYIDILWSVRNRSSMSKGTLKIKLLATYEKTEQDKLEDEKYEQMMEEYRKPFFPPIDLPEFVFTPTNNE